VAFRPSIFLPVIFKCDVLALDRLISRLMKFARRLEKLSGVQLLAEIEARQQNTLWVEEGEELVSRTHSILCHHDGQTRLLTTFSSQTSFEDFLLLFILARFSQVSTPYWRFFKESEGSANSTANSIHHPTLVKQASETAAGGV
jgi:hypothetical protein